ncbi:hypothetical protein CPB84DRAFT_1421511 [Gymnopilus junonius]|uniref:C3G9 VBS-like domain-containing protein n=1 Tax=Gymnopilus junonius TaxID=109634 RepID=A0A9P5N706_GYMJU|nr:hypothetical protein CPB84DRAFT_1421511 [Gymnopilus junonius]
MQLPDLKGNLDTGDEQLPLSRDGGVQDVHIAAFRSSLDSLLIAGRSNAPTSLLRSLREVLKAVINIIEDVKAYERRPLRDVDLNVLRSLEERAEATISILITVITSHASSSGTSPQLVSLLDAAASHVSSTVIEIGRTISARKVTEAEMAGYSIRLQDEVTEDDSISRNYPPSEYSLTSSRTETTDYGLYARRMSLSSTFAAMV